MADFGFAGNVETEIGHQRGDAAVRVGAIEPETGIRSEHAGFR